MNVTTKDPLSHFSALRTRSVDEFCQRLSGLFSVGAIDFGRGDEQNFHGRLNHYAGKDLTLSYGRYDAPLAATILNADNFIQGFPLGGKGISVVDGSESALQDNHGLVGGPGAKVSLKYSDDFQHFVLTIKPQAVIRKLGALIGYPADKQLQMDFEVVPHAPELRRLVQFVVRELDEGAGSLPPLVLAELEQSLIVSFLCGNRHNYSRFLDGTPKAAAPREVRRVEEYVEHHWDQPITIEALALIANASVRSLFYAFQKSRGISPMTFVRQARIRRAYAMLVSGEPGTSVTSVALACGFSNLGHFAKYYRNAYGELPSDTLRESPVSPRKRRNLPAET
ncbi:MAG: AraC family transcriptional regulator [Rhizobiaceae bacterium]|nr:AraC family transcriptional regulator [Rhizobiaceae bacterium]